MAKFSDIKGAQDTEPKLVKEQINAGKRLLAMVAKQLRSHMDWPTELFGDPFDSLGPMKRFMGQPTQPNRDPLDYLKVKVTEDGSERLTLQTAIPVRLDDSASVLLTLSVAPHEWRTKDAHSWHVSCLDQGSSVLEVFCNPDMGCRSDDMSELCESFSNAIADHFKKAARAKAIAGG